MKRRVKEARNVAKILRCPLLVDRVPTWWRTWKRSASKRIPRRHEVETHSVRGTGHKSRNPWVFYNWQCNQWLHYLPLRWWVKFEVKPRLCQASFLLQDLRHTEMSSLISSYLVVIIILYVVGIIIDFITLERSPPLWQRHLQAQGVSQHLQTALREQTCKFFWSELSLRPADCFDKSDISGSCTMYRVRDKNEKYCPEGLDKIHLWCIGEVVILLLLFILIQLNIIILFNSCTQIGPIANIDSCCMLPGLNEEGLYMDWMMWQFINTHQSIISTAKRCS